MSKNITNEEPAERPYTIALSKAEVIGLVNWHAAQIRRVTKVAGKVGMEIQTMGSQSKRRELATLFQVADEQFKAHAARGKHLVSLIK